MKTAKQNRLETKDVDHNGDLEAKKIVIQKRQRGMHLELGKIVAELKSGLYRLDKMPEE